jgi:hypothetical protein
VTAKEEATESPVENTSNGVVVAGVVMTTEAVVVNMVKSDISLWF